MNKLSVPFIGLALVVIVLIWILDSAQTPLSKSNVACASESSENAKYISIPSNVGVNTPISITSADFDGDGKTDIALGVNGTPNIRVYILKNDGKGNFSISK